MNQERRMQRMRSNGQACQSGNEEEVLHRDPVFSFFILHSALIRP
jgi:hypothetical protein